MTSEFVRHEPCPKCGSSDALSLYSDGHTYCFVCHDRTGGTNVVFHNNMSKSVYLTGSAERLQKRNISEKTNKFYQIYVDGNELRFPYYDESGILQGIKTKTKKQRGNKEREKRDGEKRGEKEEEREDARGKGSKKRSEE